MHTHILAHYLLYQYFIPWLMLKWLFSNSSLQRCAICHTYWNVNGAVSKCCSFIHAALSEFIHGNLLLSRWIILMRGLKGDARRAWPFSALMQGILGPVRLGPHVSTLCPFPWGRRWDLDVACSRDILPTTQPVSLPGCLLVTWAQRWTERVDRLRSRCQCETCLHVVVNLDVGKGNELEWH